MIFSYSRKDNPLINAILRDGAIYRPTEHISRNHESRGFCQAYYRP